MFLVAAILIGSAWALADDELVGDQRVGPRKGVFADHRGNRAPRGLFPFQAFIDARGADSFFCGGTLISARFVLTAAHCTAEILLNEESRIYVGVTDLWSLNSADVQSRRIASFTRHPKWNASVLGPFDIAVVELFADVKFTKYVKPIRIPFDDAFIEDSFYIRGVVSGFGANRVVNDHLRSSRHLLWTQIPFVSRNLCIELWSETNRKVVLTNKQTCAGEEGRGIGPGDSGGPLLYWEVESDEWIQVGVTSIGPKRRDLLAQDKVPGIFTRTSQFLRIRRNRGERRLSVFLI